MICMIAHCTSEYSHISEAMTGCWQIWQNESFPGFPDPHLLNSLFHTIIKLKPDVTNHPGSYFCTFHNHSAENCPPKSGRPIPAVDIGTTVAEQTYMSTCCQFQTATQKTASNIQKIPWVYFKFLEFSLSFPELTKSLRFPMFVRVVSTLCDLTNAKSGEVNPSII